MFDIQEELKKLPTCPGVYMHKDSLGEIISKDICQKLNIKYIPNKTK